METKPAASVTPADGATPETDAPAVDRTLFSITNDASGYDVARLSPGREPEEFGQDLPNLRTAVDAAKDQGAYGELMAPEQAFAPSPSSAADAPTEQPAEPASVPAAQAPSETGPASPVAEEVSPYATSPAEKLTVPSDPGAAEARYGGVTQGTDAAADQYAQVAGPAGVDPLETWGSPQADPAASEAPATQAAQIADAAFDDAATPLMDEAGADASGAPSSTGEVLGNTAASYAPPSTVDETAGWSADGSGILPEETAPVADATGTQGDVLPGQDAWTTGSVDPSISPAAYDEGGSSSPVAEAGQYDAGAAAPQDTGTYGLGGGAAATQDPWQAAQAPAPANEAVEASAAQPELLDFEAWTPSVDDGTTGGSGYGADGRYSDPYDVAGSTYEEAPAQSYDDTGASSWQPTQEVAAPEVPSGAETYDSAGTDPAAQDPASVGTAGTLGDTGTSDASPGGASNWQTSPDLSAWGDDGSASSGGSFESEPAPVASAPADAGGDLSSGGSGGGGGLSSGGLGGSGNGGDDGEGG